MLLSTAVSSLLLSILVAPIGANCLDALPFSVTHAFSAHLVLGKPLPTIAIPGGIMLAEPIISGTVSGPTINATITSGLAMPSVYENGTLQVPVIQAYGVTSDGYGFVISETGVGAPKGQVTRIELAIGGGEKYSRLRDGYILATVNPNANQTEVSVRGSFIENASKFM